MRKTVALIWLAVLLAAGGSASAAKAAVKTLTAESSDCSVANSCLVVSLPSGTSGASIALADGGSFSGTVQFEAIAGSPSTAGWVAINGYPPDSSTPASSATAAGTWKFSVSALQQIRVRFSSRSAGSIIVNINYSTGAASSGSGAGGPCVLSGSQTSGYVLTATDNATGCDWETVGGASVDNNTIVNAWYIADGGSANTISGATTTTFPGSYASGQAVIVKVKANNTGATTININSLGTKAVTKDGATALASGNLIANRDYLLIYDGTQFQAANYTKIAADFPTLNQNTTGTAANLSGTPALPNGTTATTQSPGDNSTKLATTAYADAAGGGGLTAPWSQSTDTITGASGAILDITAGASLLPPQTAQGTTDGDLHYDTTAHRLTHYDSGATATQTVLDAADVSAAASGSGPLAQTAAGVGSCTAGGPPCVHTVPVLATRECEIVWGGSGTSFALTSGDDAVADQSCYNKLGVTETITAVYCRSDDGTNTTTVNPAFGTSGSGTSILSGALTCGSSGAYSATGTVSNASLADGDSINPVMGGTLTGTSIHLVIVYTVPAS